MRCIVQQQKIKKCPVVTEDHWRNLFIHVFGLAIFTCHFNTVNYINTEKRKTIRRQVRTDRIRTDFMLYLCFERAALRRWGCKGMWAWIYLHICVECWNLRHDTYSKYMFKIWYVKKETIFVKHQVIWWTCLLTIDPHCLFNI